ncbi:MAG TPA: HEAT repeat domain-containing protein [Thermoanaerobaculia bacterium]
MPLLLVESLDAAGRELAHQHIESCAACGEEWRGMKETWALLEELPQVEVPSRVRDRFLAEVMPAATPSNVVPFHRRGAFKWLAQAAAVAIIAGGSFFAGHRTVTVQPTDAKILDAKQVSYIPSAQQQPLYSLAETRVLPASAISPNIQGRPEIDNVQFVDPNPTDGQIGLSFDITSHVTVNGSPNDKSMVRLLSYVLQSADRASLSRSHTLDVVRNTYANSADTDPEIAQALAKVLRTDDHLGMRIAAIDTLKTLPAKATTSEPTRDALIEALRSDPNPAVRIKAVEALARMVSSGQTLAPEAVDMLRQKASQNDENLYVRVKAAEALSKIH